MSVANQSMVTDALVAAVRAVVTFRVGDGTIPTVEDADGDFVPASNGYGMILRVSGGGPEGHGYYGQPESVERIRYRILGFGVRRDQAERIASAMSEIVVARDPADRSEFEWPLSVGGHSVIDRRRVSTVPTMTQGGVWQSGHDVEIVVQGIAN